MGYTADNQYRFAAEKLEEIGKLLGGWIKQAQRQART